MIQGDFDYLNPAEYLKAVDEAAERISPHVYKTPCELSRPLSQYAVAKNLSRDHPDVYLKLESQQVTGSFKARGAFNRLLSLPNEQIQKGLVTASTGNHALACAHAFDALKLSGQIFVPETIAKAKEENLAFYSGAELVKFGTDCVMTEIRAHEYADENGAFFVSPYSDCAVIAGQGTIAKEIIDQVGDIDAVFVPVGGGGLISGIGGALPSATVYGCQPVNSPVMAKSVEAKKILDMESFPTLSDGTAGGIEPGCITFDICSKFVDEFVLVSEEEIASGLRFVVENHHKIIEGSAGCAVAAYFKKAPELAGKKVVLVMCGANIGTPSLLKVLQS